MEAGGNGPMCGGGDLRKSNKDRMEEAAEMGGLTGGSLQAMGAVKRRAVKCRTGGGSALPSAPGDAAQETPSLIWRWRPCIIMCP